MPINCTPRPPSRAGSIPAVVGLATVLAVLATAAFFMTNGMNRLDRRADLTRKATWIANSAAEEVMLALLNGSAQWSTPRSGEKNVKVTFPAPATAMMYESVGALVDPVKVMARTLEAPQLDEGTRNRFYGLLSAGPRFAGNHQPNWEQKIAADPRFRRLLAPPAGVVPDPSTKASFVAPPKKGGDVALDQALGDLATAAGNPELMRNKLEKVGEAIVESATAPSCGNVAPDGGVLGALSSLALGQDITVKNAKANTDPAANAGSGDAAEDAQGRAAGKSFDYFRTMAEQAGILSREKYLITLEATASLAGADMDIEVPHTTHRVFGRLRYGDAMLFAYGRFLAYVAYHGKLSWEDLQQMGAVADGGQVLPQNFMSAVEASFSVNPGAQVWPFPVATSISRVGE